MVKLSKIFYFSLFFIVECFKIIKKIGKQATFSKKMHFLVRLCHFTRVSIKNSHNFSYNVSQKKKQMVKPSKNFRSLLFFTVECFKIIKKIGKQATFSKNLHFLVRLCHFTWVSIENSHNFSYNVSQKKKQTVKPSKNFNSFLSFTVECFKINIIFMCCQLLEMSYVQFYKTTKQTRKFKVDKWHSFYLTVLGT